VFRAFVLSVVALAPRGAPAPAAGGPFAGCEATRAGDAWVYECEAFHARATDRADRVEAGPFLDGMTGGAKTVVGGDATVARERSRLAGREADVARIARGAGEMVTAVLPSPEGTRVIECVAPAKRCEAVLEALAGLPWRAMAPGAVAGKGELELRLGGRRVAVPSGCTGRPDARGGQIVCGEAGFVVFWGEVADEESAARGAASLGAAMGAQFEACTTCRVSSDRVPCRIAGVEASCERLVVMIPVDGTRPDGDRVRFVSLRGWARLAGRMTLAACTARGTEPVPPPCTVVFEPR
jgi:hypothetical protein